MNEYRKKIKVYFLILFYVMGLVNIVKAQITVSMPDSTVCYNYDFSLPLHITTAVDDTIIAYYLQLNYNSQLIEIDKASQKGSITEAWGEPVYNSLSGKFQVVGFSSKSLFLNAKESIDTLLLVHVRVIKEFIGETNISIAKAVFYNMQGQHEGEISVESGARLNIVHNEPPYINDFGDITLFEDSTYTVNIISYIGDPDNSMDELDISLQGDENFSYIFDGSSLTIIPDPDWSGVSTLRVTVSDLYRYSDADTFQVTVLPLEDDPKPFGLISPQDTIYSEGENEIEFFWEESVNVDKNDSVTYTFFLGTDSTFQSGILRKHPSLIDESILIIISLDQGVYYWGVNAVDSRGREVWCTDKYRTLTVQGMGINTPEPNLLKQFEIYQNHPNPFNSQTSIEYQLPSASDIKIDIWDVNGRYITTLLYDYMDAGRHSVVWKGRNHHNSAVSSGIYFVSVKAGNNIKVKKIVLVK